MELRALLDALWTPYVRVTPDASRIHGLLEARGERIENDHIALRTYAVDTIGIESLSRPFTERGYRYDQDHDFPEKKLRAKSYIPPSPDLPRLFISELLIERMSTFVQSTARELAGSVARERAGTPELLLHGPTWPSVSHSTYERLLDESEYAAWVAAFGIRVNHFTVSFNALKTFASLEEFTLWLRDQGFPMNESGGLIKGTPAALLEQSSTLANRIPWPFAGGETHVIPSCYYEFARRYVDPATGKMYDGFVAKSADKIFESTDVRRGQDRVPRG